MVVLARCPSLCSKSLVQDGANLGVIMGETKEYVGSMDLMCAMVDCVSASADSGDSSRKYSGLIFGSSMHTRPTNAR